MEEMLPISDVPHDLQSWIGLAQLFKVHSVDPDVPVRLGKELFLIGSLGIEQGEVIRLVGEPFVHIPLWVDEHFVRVE